MAQEARAHASPKPSTMAEVGGLGRSHLRSFVLALAVELLGSSFSEQVPSSHLGCLEQKLLSCGHVAAG